MILRRSCDILLRGARSWNAEAAAIAAALAMDAKADTYWIDVALECLRDDAEAGAAQPGGAVHQHTEADAYRYLPVPRVPRPGTVPADYPGLVYRSSSWSLPAQS
jgi:hypothetical protein